MKKEDFKLKINKAEDLTSDFTKVPNIVWTDKRLSNADIRILGYLMSHKDGFPANKTFLAKGIGMSRSFFVERFQHLENLKILSVVQATLTFNLNQLSVAIKDSVGIATDKCRLDDSDVSVNSINTVRLDDTNNKKKQEDVQKDIQEDKQEDKQGNDNIVSDVLPEVTLDVLPLNTLDDNNTSIDIAVKLPSEDITKIKKKFKLSPKPNYKEDLYFSPIITNYCYSLYENFGVPVTYQQFQKIYIVDVFNKFFNDSETITNWKLNDFIYNNRPTISRKDFDEYVRLFKTPEGKKVLKAVLELVKSQ